MVVRIWTLQLKNLCLALYSYILKNYILNSQINHLFQNNHWHSRGFVQDIVLGVMSTGAYVCMRFSESRGGCLQGVLSGIQARQASPKSGTIPNKFTRENSECSLICSNINADTSSPHHILILYPYGITITCWSWGFNSSILCSAKENNIKWPTTEW